jgi:hypothetical protein
MSTFLTGKTIVAIIVIVQLLQLLIFYHKIESLEQKKKSHNSKHLPAFSYIFLHSHIFYVHYMDTNDRFTVENFVFFMNFAYLPCDPQLFFTIVLNRRNMDTNLMSDLERILGSKTIGTMKNCMYNELNLSNTDRGARNTKLVVRLNDQGGDLCANSDLLKSEFFKSNEQLFYYYFFINSSVRGPFLPNYYLKKWWEMFVDMFHTYENTVAVGPYMSCEYSPHIQSFFIVVDRRGLEYVKGIWRCPNLEEIQNNRVSWIVDTEVVSKTLNKPSICYFIKL